jgi:glutathione S-transferase
VNHHLADRRFILGSEFSFADINIGYCLNWGRCAGLTSDLPNVNAYLDRLNERPACALVDQTEFFKKLRQPS